jgi:hypothetical protein
MNLVIVYFKIAAEPIVTAIFVHKSLYKYYFARVMPLFEKLPDHCRSLYSRFFQTRNIRRKISAKHDGRWREEVLCNVDQISYSCLFRPTFFLSPSLPSRAPSPSHRKDFSHQGLKLNSMSEQMTGFGRRT